LKKLEHENCVAIPKVVVYELESSLRWPLLVIDKVGVDTMYQITLPLVEHNRIQIMADLREAVDVLHRHGLVYVDWHPANVMWRREEASGATMRALLIDYNECVPDGTSLDGPIRFNSNFAASALNRETEDDLLSSIVMGVVMTYAFDLESLLYIELFLKTGTLPWFDDDNKASKKKQWLLEASDGASQRDDEE
jgi:hypothetical protein